MSTQGNFKDSMISMKTSLPQEILEMSESETACQYCGVSYLILSKCERMEQLVKEMEEERASLREFIEERPLIKARVETLQKSLSDASLREKEFEIKLNQSREREEGFEQGLETMREELKATRQSHNKDVATLLQRKKQDMNERNNNIRLLQHSLLQIRNEFAQSKGLIKRSINHQLEEAVKESFKLLADKLQAQHSKKAEELLIAERAKASSQGKSLQGELEQARLELKQTEASGERLAEELSRKRQEYTDHSNSQKAYIQELQANRIGLEDRLNSSNREMMELSTVRDRLDKERRELQTSLYADSTKHQDLEEKLHELQCELIRMENLHKIQVEELKLKQEINVNFSDADEAQKAFQALAKKDVQMMELEKALKEANSVILSAREERIKTIDAHQSRIKHLQEKFLQDIQTASKDHVTLAEGKLRNEMTKLHEEAMESLRLNIRQEADEREKALSEKMDYLKERETRALKSLELEQKKARSKESSNEMEIHNLQRQSTEKIKKLEGQLSKQTSDLEQALRNANPLSAQAERQIEDFKVQLAKKEKEIAFLKETVRVECEERMGLVGSVAKLQKEISSSRVIPNVAAQQQQLLTQQKTARSPSPSNMVTNSKTSNNPLATAIANIDTSSDQQQPSLSSKDEEFFKLFKNANAKNVKRLAKQSRTSSLGNY